MRRLLLILLIALLPLRSGVGDAMAVGMAAGAVAHNRAQAAMPADCPMHASGDPSATGTPCSSCDTCGLCVATAPAPLVCVPGSATPSHAAPTLPARHFASAALWPRFKPPIT
jgi:hypothetical protein